MNKKRLSGDMIGVMTFLYYLPKIKGSTRGRFICFCGNEFEARIGDVRNDQIGCGCRKRGDGHPKYKHGHSPKIKVSLTYSSWKGAISRCTLPSHNKYKDYGEKGISVCERWRSSFENFLADMGERPSKLHTLDRFPNREGNYEPGNCRWATKEEQLENRGNTLYVTYNGVTKSLAKWAQITGVLRKTLQGRLYKGWSADEILNGRDAIEEHSGRCANYPLWVGLPIIKMTTQKLRVA